MDKGLWAKGKESALLHPAAAAGLRPADPSLRPRLRFLWVFGSILTSALQVHAEQGVIKPVASPPYPNQQRFFGEAREVISIIFRFQFFPRDLFGFRVSDSAKQFELFFCHLGKIRTEFFSFQAFENYRPVPCWIGEVILSQSQDVSAYEG